MHGKIMKKRIPVPANPPLHSEDADLTGVNGKGRNSLGQFAAGNPGRPVGSRNRLSEQFLSALAADWEEHGVKVLQKVREERPQDYLRVVASILPRELQVAKVDDFDELSDEELERSVMDELRELTQSPSTAHWRGTTN